MYIPDNKNREIYLFTAYAVTKNGTKIPFRYKYAEVEDLERSQILSGVESTKVNKVLITNSDYDFTPETQVKLNDITYMITNIKRDYNEHTNGMFVQDIHTKVTALAISKNR